MPQVADVAAYLDAFAPAALAAEWDNVGLLVGDRNRPVARLMTALTVTEATVEEALSERADLVVVHHPFPFRALKRVSTDSRDGRLLWALAAAGVSVYSPHTAFDSCAGGINAQLAAGLGLADVRPLRAADPAQAGPETGGTGRQGSLAPALKLDDLAARVKQFLRIDAVQCVGAAGRPIGRVAVGCGSAGELLDDAIEAGCECLVTGELRFHACLEAEAAGLALIVAGHYATERFAVESLAPQLAAAFPAVACWASRRESDPLRWV